MNIDFGALLNKLWVILADIGPNLLWAVVTLIIGWKLIAYAVVLTEKAFDRVDFDESLESFFTSVVSIGLKVVLLVTVAGMLGLETTTLITMLGAMAFAVGMALQGSLANLAGGVLILVFKPFKVGDFIEAQGYSGKVKAIQIFQTILLTPDNKQVTIPNGDLSNGAVINYTATGQRRLDMVFGIGYGDDLAKAKSLLNKIVLEDKRVLKNKDIQIALGNLGDSAVEIYVRVWVRSADYFALKFDLNERVKEIFDKEGVNFPYPQMDVHLEK